jgi:enolase
VGDEGGFAPNIQNNKEGLDLLVSAIAKGNHATIEDENSLRFLFFPGKEVLIAFSLFFSAGYTGKVVIGMDVAASEFCTEDRRYDLDFKTKNNDGKFVITADQLRELYKEFIREYPVVSIEDPFDQDDWDAYAKLTAEVGQNTQIVGDDLLVTNPKRITTAIERKACNALLLKVNQIGSVTESIRACKMAQVYIVHIAFSLHMPDLCHVSKL